MDMITTTDALKKACKALETAPYITVDTEFMRDKTYWPKLCLIQMASRTEGFLVDPLAKGIDLQPFFDLMAHPKVIKVFHAARQDIEIFYHQGGVIPDPLFDTQVAAMVCGFGESVGYETLVRKIAKEKVDKTSRFTDWSHRPLSEKQLAYALADVTHLRPVYEAFAKQLSETGRVRWVAEEMAILQSPATYDLKPEDAWKRLKMRVRNKRQLAVLTELAAWREREAQSRDLPRNRVMKDDALYELATQQPKAPGDLDRLRAVPKGFSGSKSAQSLIAAIKAGQDRPEDELPEPDNGKVMPPGIGPIIELLKVLLKLRSEENDVAPKLIATVSDLEDIAASDTADVLALTGWRREIFGNDALALKHGKLGLSVKGKKLVAAPLQTEKTATAAD